MADDPGGTASSRAKDLDLLSSGNFADVDVICGDRTWKCHRAILVPRSVWFDKALSGPFEEATTRQVKLNEENPDFVDLALKYIYGESLDVEASVSDEHFVEHCVFLWHTADYLLLEPLKSMVEKAVHSYCDRQMKQLCTFSATGTKFIRLWSDDKDTKKLAPWALDMLSGVRESYRLKTQHLKAVLMEFLWVGRAWTLRLPTSSALFDHLKDTPEFVEDFLDHHASHSWIENAVWAPASRSDITIAQGKSACRRCAKKISWANSAKKDGQTLDPFELNTFNKITTGWCRDCASLDMIPWRT